MDNFRILNLINELYKNSGNIMEYLRNNNSDNFNTVEDIMISYDFQAGSYIKFYNENKEFKNKYCGSIYKVIKELGEYDSIMEAGVGEGTTLGPLLKYFICKSEVNSYGFDISWSRLKYAKKLFSDLKIKNCNFFTGDLFNIPISDNSIDIVYTSHTIEPNGGKEEEILKELYRITKKYLILLEPIYEFADEEGKERMNKYGYVKNLYETIKKLNYNVLEYRRFDIIQNNLNPTGLIIIEKNSENINRKVNNYICPITKTELKLMENVYYSEKSFLSYPIIQGIPCLLSQNAILTSKLMI